MDLALNNLHWLICYKTKSDSVNKVNIIAYRCTFLKEINNERSQNFFSMTYVSDCCHQNFFFTGESVRFHSINSPFDSGKLMFN